MIAGERGDVEPGPPEREQMRRVGGRRRHIGRRFDGPGRVRNFDVADHDITTAQQRPCRIEERIRIRFVQDQIADEKNAHLP